MRRHRNPTVPFRPNSQAGRILALMQERRDIPLYEITNMVPRIADHRSCIRYLREAGHQITHTQYWQRKLDGGWQLCVVYHYGGFVHPNLIVKDDKNYKGGFSETAIETLNKLIEQRDLEKKRNWLQRLWHSIF